MPNAGGEYINQERCFVQIKLGLPALKKKVSESGVLPKKPNWRFCLYQFFIQIATFFSGHSESAKSQNYHSGPEKAPFHKTNTQTKGLEDSLAEVQDKQNQCSITNELVTE